MADVHELLDTWLANVQDEDLLAELKAMKEAGDEDAITDAFFQDLEFGTAGLRGTLGAGTNRMNIYTVGRATQGFAEYLVKNFENPTVAIARDSRNNGELFVKTAAAIFAANPDIDSVIQFAAYEAVGESVASSPIEAPPEEEVVTHFKINERGQTYGSAEDVEVFSFTGDTPLSDNLPDLVRVRGNNGNDGYVYSEDLLRGGAGRKLPVFEEDGITVIDTFMTG